MKKIFATVLIAALIVPGPAFATSVEGSFHAQALPQAIPLNIVGNFNVEALNSAPEKNSLNITSPQEDKITGNVLLEESLTRADSSSHPIEKVVSNGTSNSTQKKEIPNHVSDLRLSSWIRSTRKALVAQKENIAASLSRIFEGSKKSSGIDTPHLADETETQESSEKNPAWKMGSQDQEEGVPPLSRPASNGDEDRQSSTSQPPPPPPNASAASRRSVQWFISGMLVAQVGIETLGLAMPLLMRQKFGGFSALTHIAVISSAAGIIGQLSGGWIANKLGAKTSYIAANILRLLSITTMIVFLMSSTAPLVTAQAALIGFYSFNSLMAGVALTAQKSIPTILLGNDRATLERFYSLQQWTLEIMGVSGPKIGSTVIQAFGFTAALAIYPIALLIAVGMYLFGIRIPKEGSAHNEFVPATPHSTFSRVMAPLTPMNRAISGAIKGISNKIAAFIDSLVLKAYLGRWIAAKGGQGHLTDADERDILWRSTLGWTMAAILSLSAFATLLLPTVLPAYVAMVVFGVAEVIATQKLYSMILSRTKGVAETVKVNAVAGAVFAAIYAGALNGVGMLFEHLSGHMAFLYFAAAMLPVAAITYLLKRMISNLEAKNAPSPARRSTSGFGLLFKDPMMRWAFLIYSLLGMTNPLLYQILSQAFGLAIVGSSAAAASSVASWITSLYSLGGLLGALYMWRESTLISNARNHQ